MRIYDEAIAMLAVLRGTIEAIRRRDRDLAWQMSRCSTSVVLNINEASAPRGGNRRALFAVAFGSLRETQAGLEAARALGYIDAIDAELARRLHALGGPLYTLSQ
jgi:four helix bundle protein